MLEEIFPEQTLKQLKRKCECMEVPIGIELLNTLRFADHQAIIAQDEEDLRFIVRKLDEEYNRNGLAII